MLYINHTCLKWMDLTRGADRGTDGEPDRRTVLEMRGEVSGAPLSPDGNRVAFSSSRGTHSYIGVVPLPAAEPDHARWATWLDPSVDSDGAPAS